MAVRYEADFAGIGDLMRGDEMQDVMRQVAEGVMADAVATAPVYHGPPKRGVTPGEYKSAFRLEVTGDGGVSGDRAEARVVNDSPISVLVEWYDKFHTLRDAVESLEAE